MFPTFKYQNTLATQRYANALYDIQLGSNTLGLVLEDMAAVGQDAALNSYFEAGFGNASLASVAATMTQNLNVIDGQYGLTAVEVSAVSDYIEFALSNAAAGSRGAVVAEIAELWSSLSADATFGAAATAWNAEVAGAMAYTGTTDVVVGTAVADTAFLLTSGIDNITGTTGDDFFDSPLSQNAEAGGMSNALSTADTLDGGAGNDTLNATLVAEFFGTAGLQQLDIQPEVANIENIQFEVKEILSDSIGVIGVIGAPFGAVVTVDAKDITDVDHIGSYYSDGNLVIENLTTLTSSGVARNTSAVTVTMDHTDNYNSDNNASDLIVYFDEDYLLAGQEVENTLELRIVNAFELAENAAPLVGFLSVEFNVGATTVTVDISAETTYAGVAAAINAELASLGINTVTATTLAARNAVFTDDIGVYTQGSIAGTYLPVRLTSTDQALTAGPIELDSNVLDFDGLNTWTNPTSVTQAEPVTVNIELEKVGRGGEGGDLIIGGKEQDLDGGAEDQGNGIDTFNIVVMGDASQPSNLGNIASTNNALTTVNISSAAGSEAALHVRDAFNAVAGTAMETIDANAFLNALNIGQDTASRNVDTFTAQGGGAITYNALMDGTEKSMFTISTGTAGDTVVVALDGDAVDAIGTGLTISTSAGNDTVTVTNTDAGAGVSDQTNLALGAQQGVYASNLAIVAGSGADRVNVFAEDIFNVLAGADSDFVYVNADNDGTVNNGAWSIGDGTAAIGADWVNRVLYQATLTVDFAGFTQTVTIPTNASGNFIATQEMINDAVIAAIAANSELSRLLTATTANGDAGSELLNIVSTVEGDNDLTISVNQPTVVAAGAVAGQVNFIAGDLAAFQAGLVATTANDSFATDTVAEIVAIMAGLDGNLNETGAAVANDFVLDSVDGVDGLNDAASTSMAIIDMGAGTNDLVVLDSAIASMDTVVFSAVWGKVSILNFFQAQFNDLGDANLVNVTVTDHTFVDELVGNHILDFTAWLDDQVTTSTSTLSGVRIATTFEVEATAANLDDFVANEVTIVNNFAVGVDANETWAAMTAADVQNSLNAGIDVNTVGTGYGNLSNDGTNTITAGLLGTTHDNILMIENTANRGEYKVFNLDVVEATDVFTVTYLGVIDFGESIDAVAVANFA